MKHSKKFKIFVSYMNLRFNKYPKILRSDNSDEYSGLEFDEFFKKGRNRASNHWILLTFDEWISERKNRSPTEMLLNANLPYKYWGEAVQTTTYLQNRLPAKILDKSLFEIWNGYSPYLGHFKVFGCKAYTFFPKQNRRKFQNRAQEGIFIGYDVKPRWYQIVILE